jgi:hypothetical protein
MTTDNIGPGKAFLWGLVFKRIPEASTDATASDLTEKVKTPSSLPPSSSGSTGGTSPTSLDNTKKTEDDSGLDLPSSPISEKPVEGEEKTEEKPLSTTEESATKESEDKKPTKTSMLVTAMNVTGIVIGVLLTLLTGGLYGIIALAFRGIHYLATRNEGKPTKENTDTVFINTDIKFTKNPLFSKAEEDTKLNLDSIKNDEELKKIKEDKESNVIKEKTEKDPVEEITVIEASGDKEEVSGS